MILLYTMLFTRDEAFVLCQNGKSSSILNSEFSHGAGLWHHKALSPQPTEWYLVPPWSSNNRKAYWRYLTISIVNTVIIVYFDIYITVYSCTQKNCSPYFVSKKHWKIRKCDFCLRCKRESLLLPSVPRSKDRCHGWCCHFWAWQCWGGP